MTIKTSKKLGGSRRGPQNMRKCGNTVTPPLGATRSSHIRLCASDKARRIDNSPRCRPCGSRWRQHTMDACPLTVMVNPDDPQPPWLVGEVLGTVQLPDNLVRALLAWFQVTREDVRTMSTKKRSSRGLYSFVGYLASGVDLVSGFHALYLIGVNQKVTVHLLHLLFSVPVGLYYTAWGISACGGDMPCEGLLLVVDLPVYAFAVRRSVRAIPRVFHLSHM